MQLEPQTFNILLRGLVKDVPCEVELASLPRGFLKTHLQKMRFYKVRCLRHSPRMRPRHPAHPAHPSNSAEDGKDGVAGEAGYQGVQHLVYASSSSVYGGNKKVPFATEDPVDHPVSLYAATKKSNELLAHAYSKLYNIPSTGLRFFTVIGPAGRPDMALMGFTDKLCHGKKIQIFNYGDMKRDFTDVDDIVEGIIRVMAGAPEKENGPDGLPIPPYAVYNIGGGKPENLLNFVTMLQEELVRAKVLPEDYDFEAHRELVPMQPGDVPITYADTEALEADYGFVPKIPLRETLRKYCEWHMEYYGAAKLEKTV